MSTTQQRQRDIVYGYVRLNYEVSFTLDVIDIIYNFYLIQITSNILNLEEQCSFMNLLYNRLKQQKENENIKSINTKLLFRASDNDYKCDETFHDFCDDQGATVTIIHNEHDHIFGGYTSKSWKLDEQLWFNDEKDASCFLFMIRPKLECVEWKESVEKGKEAITSSANFGPIFGEGWDIYLYNSYTDQTNNDGQREMDIRGSGKSQSFEYLKQEMFGTDKGYGFKVLDFEVFSIIFE